MGVDRRVLRIVGRVALVLLVIVAGAMIGAGFWARSTLRASLPAVDGEQRVEHLSAPVDVKRDALGIPSVRAANRLDLARAMGFLHAQDRFFQMDTARRRAAGELAELVGPRAIALDREIRIHRFRAEARKAVGLLEAGDRRVLDAYTAGVNAGLLALGARPFEYLLLGQDPLLWQAEDSLLVVLSMFITLQDTDGSYEATLATMSDLLPPEMFAFMAPRGTEWDSPVVGDAFATPPIPPAHVFDARSRRQGRPPLNIQRRQEVASRQIPNPKSQIPRLLQGPKSQLEIPIPTSHWSELGVALGNWSFERTLGFGDWDLGFDSGHNREAVGSNSFAVAARLTNSGALVANDMHLSIRVPNTWYRAAWEWLEPADTEPRRMYGVTLPGVPAMVVGSNTHVAWGFTNTYADWSDIVLLETDPKRPGMYLTPGGWRRVDRYEEVIAVAGQPAQSMTVEWTAWGPVLGPDHRGRLRAYRWVAHSAERLAASIAPLEGTRTIEEAFDAVNGLGTPGQNFVVADRSGRIGWTVYGSIPRRHALDGQLPASWADGRRGWDGWLEDKEYPRMLDGRDGRIWTANARVVDGPMLAALGDGSYEIGSRARIIRDRLLAMDRYTPRDLLGIQLDTQAGFLKRWRDLILSTLTAESIGGNQRRAQFREVVEKDWPGQARPESAGYRLTRAFRERVSQWVFTFVLADCYEVDRHFDYTTVRRREGPIWRLVSEQPPHLLDPRFPTWSAMLEEAVDEVIEEVTRGRSGDLAERRWSEMNAVAFRHPLSAALPVVGRWLDMPHHEIPGDLYTPRMMWGSSGASERMVVSPGREAEGIMHMPIGQSGHPLSPFYANSHDAWVKGEPTPFLPGETRHTLRLMP